MKVIGKDEKTRAVVLTCNFDELDSLLRSSGIPHDKRSDTRDFPVAPIHDASVALWEIKTFRKDLGKLMAKYDELAARIDAALEK